MGAYGNRLLRTISTSAPPLKLTYLVYDQVLQINLHRISTAFGDALMPLKSNANLVVWGIAQAPQMPGSRFFTVWEVYFKGYGVLIENSLDILNSIKSTSVSLNPPLTNAFRVLLVIDVPVRDEFRKSCARLM